MSFFGGNAPGPPTPPPPEPPADPDAKAARCIVCSHDEGTFVDKQRVMGHVKAKHENLLRQIGWHNIDHLWMFVEDELPATGKDVFAFLRDLDSLIGAEDFVAECEIHDGRKFRLL